MVSAGGSHLFIVEEGDLNILYTGIEKCRGSLPCGEGKRFKYCWVQGSALAAEPRHTDLIFGIGMDFDNITIECNGQDHM